ncbi:restriction endonuclease subunit S [Methylophilus sp. VKM B-3414]|uniref:restriction endonuclease subunit S n=1 Tax=Methylophilus sp. VKM B-3414 TaxID=3076121 RepID=UPI0028C9F7F7|nr:restriction endonuclease subunit S [Methylophilus sp. VKM B-3414]MDT7849400.1 restriction endonuclease subunit S [Methylophilus sp. VKM B-3414]
MSLPSLRFKEFEGNDWELKRLDSFLEKASYPVKVESNELYREIGIRSHGKGIFHKDPIKGSDIGNKRVFWVQPEALVLNIVFAWEQALAVTSDAERGFIASHRFPMYTPKANNCYTQFLKYLFLTKKGKSYLELASPGGAGRNKTLGQKNFDELIVRLPSLKEQAKIANFLMAVDKKIGQLTQKYELLAQYKKGVLQQVFSQKVRFKDDNGQNYSDWENYPLNDVLVKNSSKNRNCEFTLVQSVTNKHGFINQDELFEGRVIASKDLSNYYIIKKGAFAYNPSRIDVGSLAYKGDDLISVVSPLYVSFYAKPNLIVDRFLLNWFTSQNFKTQMNSSFEGSVRNTLSYDALSKIIVSLPCLEEQTKISDLLSVIEDKLTHTQIQLAAAKQYKQGLLQQMFV